MRKPSPLSLLIAVSTTFAACGGVQDSLTAFQKATYAEAASATTSGLTESPSDEESATTEESPGQGEQVLIQDCSLPAAEQRVRDRCDGNRDGRMGDDEEASLEGDFPPPRDEGSGVPPLLPPPGSEGASGGGGRGPRGDGEGRPPPPPQCEGTRTIEELASQPPPPREHHRGPDWRKLQFAYDADDSHALDDVEKAALEADLAAGCEARNARLIARFDANADGALDDAETSAAQETLEADRAARHLEHLTAADTDGDGSLTCEELQAAHEARRAEHEAERAQFDTNGDGALDDTEKAAAREAIKERIRSGLLPGETLNN